MPVAILAASSYNLSTKLPDLPSQVDELFELDRSLAGAGYRTEVLDAGTAFPEKLKEALTEGSESDQVFLYFGGYAGLSKQGKAALLLDARGAPGAIGFERLQALLEEPRSGGAIVLDVALVAPRQADSVRDFMAALSEAHSGQLDVFLVARRARTRDESDVSPFANELTRRLDAGEPLDHDTLSRVLALVSDGERETLLLPAKRTAEPVEAFDGALDFGDADASPDSDEGKDDAQSDDVRAHADAETAPNSAPLPHYDLESERPGPRSSYPPSASLPPTTLLPPPGAHAAGARLVPPPPPAPAVGFPPPPPPAGSFPPPTRGPGRSSAPAAAPPHSSLGLPAALPLPGPVARSGSAPSLLTPPPPPVLARPGSAPGIVVPPPPPPGSALRSPLRAGRQALPSPATIPPPPPPHTPPGETYPLGEATGVVPSPPPPLPSPGRPATIPPPGAGGAGLSIAPPPVRSGPIPIGVPPPPPPVGVALSSLQLKAPPPPPITIPPPTQRTPGHPSERPPPLSGPAGLTEPAPPPSSPTASEGLAPEEGGLPTIIIAPHADKPEEQRPPQTPTTPAESVDLARHYEAAGQHDAAANEYLRALYYLGAGTTPEHVDLFIKLGRAQRRAGDSEASLQSYGYAFNIDATSSVAVDAAKEILAEQREFERAERLLRMHLKAVPDDEAKVSVLKSIVDLWTDRAGEPLRSLPALKRWVALRPDALEAWQRCIVVEELAGKYADAIVSRRRAAAQLTDSRARAEVLLAAAETAQTKLEDAEQAEALVTEALSYDPALPRAIELAEQRYRAASDWEALAELYDRALAHGLSDAGLAAKLSRELGRICTDELGDPARAVRAYECLLTTGEGDARTYAWLVSHYEEAGELERAAGYCRAWARSLPTSAPAYRSAYSLFHKSGAADAAWNAASVLECLGEADIDESLLVDAHKPEGLLPVTQNLNFVDWAEGQLTPPADPALAAVLREAVEPLVAAKLERMKKQRALLELPQTERQAPESTTTLSRSLMWTARVLGVPAPALYVSGNGTRNGALTVVPALEPSVLADKSLGSGFSLTELSFLWGRQLSLYRREHHLLAYYPNDSDLAELSAAVYGVCSEQPGALGQLDREAKKLASLLAKSLSDASKERIGQALRGRSAYELTQALLMWAEQVRVLAGRAGLVACGDIGVAVALAKRFPLEDRPAERQIEDVFAYAISQEYSALRAKLGIAVHH